MDPLTRWTAAPLACLLLAAHGCAPVVEDESAQVSAPRLLATRAEPAEVTPGARLRVTALIATPADAPAPTPAWSLCLRRPGLASASPVDEACRGGDPSAARALGEGVSTELTVPMDACARFGPDPPVGQGTAVRPADPDVTGGYTLPLRVQLPGSDGFASVRLRCNLSGVTREVAAEYAARARPNTNPAIESVARVRAGAEEPVGDALTVARGERVVLRLSWPACQGADGCEGAETYLRFDPVLRALSEAREAMRASWYATGGRFDAPRTGRARDDLARVTENAWTAPGAAGAARLWVALRDERGGVAWRSVAVEVR